MKRNYIILIILLFGLISACEKTNTLYEYEKGEFGVKEFEITDSKLSFSEPVFEKGCVQNEQVAAEVALPILKSIYGDNCDSGLPLIVGFDEKEENWLIRTQLPKDPNIDGGNCYIVIRKRNAEVVAIWGTK